MRDLITEAAADVRRARDRAPTQQRIGDLYASFMDDATPSRGRRRSRCSTSSPPSTPPPTPTRWPPCSAALQRTGVGGGTGRLRRHRLEELHALPAALSPVRPRPARRVVLPRPAARRDPGRLPRPHRADVRAGLRRATTPATCASTAARIVALETKLAAAHWDVVKRRDADLTYNLRTFADLPAEAPGFDWAGWVARAGHHAGARRPRSSCASPTS